MAESEIEQLREQLEQERAYSKTLEIERDMQIERRVEAEVKQAELRGYQRGVQTGTSGWTEKTASEFASALQAELNARIPEMLDNAWPDQYRHLLNPKQFAQAMSVECRSINRPDTYELDTRTYVRMEPINFNLGMIMRSPL